MGPRYINHLPFTAFDPDQLTVARGDPSRKFGAGETTKQQGGRAKNALLAVANGDTAT
jgi:hypothetical protein